MQIRTKSRWTASVLSYSRWYALLLPAVTLPFACYSDPSDEVTLTSSELTGGMRDSGDPSVVLLLSWDPANPVGTLGSCTAEVVAPNVLLTAAHCLQKKHQYAAYLGDDGRDLGTPIDPGKSNVRSQLHLAKEIHAHPQYVTTAGYFDIGVVILQDKLTGIPTLPINRTRPSASALSNVSIVGYGKTHDRDTTFAVTKYRADGLSATLDATHTMTVGDAAKHACVGDSGGPVLAQINGVSTIVGTDSYSDETGDASRCRIASHYQRVDTYLSFIDQHVPREVTGGPADAGLDGSTASGDAGSSSGSDASVDAGRARDGGAGADSGAMVGMASTDGSVIDSGRSDGNLGLGDSSTGQADASALGSTADLIPDDESDDGGCTVAKRTSKSSTQGTLVFAVLIALLLGRRRGPRTAARVRKVAGA